VQQNQRLTVAVNFEVKLNAVERFDQVVLQKENRPRLRMGG
jgi:hypothetical protein